MPLIKNDFSMVDQRLRVYLLEINQILLFFQVSMINSFVTGNSLLFPSALSTPLKAREHRAGVLSVQYTLSASGSGQFGLAGRFFSFRTLPNII